jgi:hypothetical protein
MSDHSPTLSYWTVQPSRWTFAATKIRAWVEHYLEGRVLNACCGLTELSHDGVIKRNDIQRRIQHNGTVHETNADTHLDVRNLTDQYETESFDVIIFDPPFSDNQAQSSYNLAGDHPTDATAYEELDSLLKPDGKIIQFGFSSSALASHPNYEPTHISLWNLFGRQHDWFGTIAKRSPEQPATNGAPREIHSTVLPNPVESVPALKKTNVTASGNDGIPIPITYKRLPASACLETAVAETVTDHLAGHALVVGESVGHYHDAYDGPLTANTTTPRYPFDTTYAIQQLSEAYPEGTFDHVVLDLPSKATSATVSYDGSTTGYDTVAKAESHPLLTDHGTITLVGHSATTMSQLTYDNYTRHRMSVLAHPDHARDIIISTDRLNSDRNSFPTPSPPEDREAIRPPADIENTTRHQAPHPNWFCDHCETSWYFHPALHVNCLECGARPDNYCVDENDTPLRHIHAHRLATWQQNHLQSHSIEPLATTDSLDASKGFGNTTPADTQRHLSEF